jgi:hypothetical protein
MKTIIRILIHFFFSHQNGKIHFWGISKEARFVKLISTIDISAEIDKGIYVSEVILNLEDSLSFLLVALSNGKIFFFIFHKSDIATFNQQHTFFSKWGDPAKAMNFNNNTFKLASVLNLEGPLQALKYQQGHSR